MTLLKKFIAILAVSFVGVAGNLNADILDEIPADIRDFVYNPDFMDPNQPLGESVYRNWKSDRPLPWTIGYASSCLLYTSPSPRDLSTSRMPSSA